MQNKQLEELITDIYRELYKNANPPRDFDQMVEYHKGTDIPYWMEICISTEKSDSIMDSFLKGRRLTPLAKQKIKNTVYLGVSPRYCD